MTKSKRYDFLDYLKGFLILFVVWWHVSTIFQGGGSANYFFGKNITAAFGMPLFMVISGYFLFGSCKKYDIKQLLIHKVQRVLLPCIIWESLMVCISRNLWFYGSTWYLWCYFFASTVLIFIVKLVHNSAAQIICMVTAGLFIWLLPSDKWFLAWMFPFLAMGYTCRQYRLEERFSLLLQIGAIAIFCSLLVFWKPEHMVYLAGSSLLKHPENWWIALYRFAIGCAGCLSALCVFKWLYQRKGYLSRIIIKAGQFSFEIYILQRIAVEFLLAKVLSHFSISIVSLTGSKFVSDYLLSPLFSVVVTAGCILFAEITGRSKWLAAGLWGKWRRKTE